MSDQPVRAGKFVPRKQWIVAGSDDMQIRVYNYNTMEKVRRPPPLAPLESLRCVPAAPPGPTRPRTPAYRTAHDKYT